jgi:primosomal protein N' (replication factor Y)
MFAEILLFIPKSNLNNLFDYIIPTNFANIAQKGMRVIIPFGSKNTHRLGYIVNIKDQSDLAEKYIIEIIDQIPFLNKELFLLIEEILKIPFISKISAYKTIIPNSFLVSYKKKINPLEENLIPNNIKEYFQKKKWCLNLQDSIFKKKEFKKLIKKKIIETEIVIKNLLKKNKNIKIIKKENKKIKKQNINLQQEQKRIFNEIIFTKSQTYLLYYQTNLLKMNFYLKIIEKNIKNKKQILILIPEIILIKPFLNKILKYFPNIAISVLNSKLSNKENYIQNQNIKNQKISLVIGTKSAIFAPLENIGTIIIDDEHNESLIETKKNIQYDSRELAKIRSIFHKIPLILSSNTPSVRSYYKFLKKKYQFLTLEKEKKNSQMKLIDMKEEMKKGNLEPFSRELSSQLEQKIKKKEKIMLFINTRGFAPFCLCRFCGYILKCFKCNKNLTFFSKENILKCKLCVYKQKFEKKCSCCKQFTLKNVSFGIEYIEYFLKKKFNNIKIARIDSDTISNSKEYEKIIEKYKKNKINILLGTEMIDKKIELPKISLVGIIMADVLLNIPTFKASEKTFQLITQIANHCENLNQVIVQSYDIEHYAIVNAVNNDIKNFFQNVLKDRKLTNNPPFVFLSNIIIYHISIIKILKIAKKIKNFIDFNKKQKIKVLNPIFPKIFKKKNFYKIYLTIKYKQWPLDLSFIQEYIQDKNTNIFFDLFANQN